MHSAFGLNTSLEGDKYLTNAEHIVHGNFSEGLEYQYLYGSYIFYLSVFKLLHLSNYLIFLSNYALSVFSYYCFYKLLEQKADSLFGKVWLTLMLLSPLVQYWQLNLFSETFFISLNLFFCYVLFSNNQKNRFIKLFFLGLAMVFARPSGILSLSVFTLFYFISSKNIHTKNIVSLSLTIGILLFLMFFFLIPIHYKGYCVDITSGSVYCGFPEFQNPIMPAKDYTLWECYYYLYNQHGIGYMIKLFLQKTGSFFGLSRPYYSTFHNLINIGHYIFYILGFMALYKTKSLQNNTNVLFHMSACIIVLNALLIGLFFNEWSERYTLVVMPFVFILATGGIIKTYNLLKSNIAF